jgi:hypothetical protein
MTVVLLVDNQLLIGEAARHMLAPYRARRLGRGVGEAGAVQNDAYFQASDHRGWRAVSTGQSVSRQFCRCET